MAASTVIKHLYDGSIRVLDGTGTPVLLTVPFTIGDLTIAGLKRTLKNTVKYETRGTLRSVRHSSRVFPTGSFSVQIADYSDATDQTLIDFLLKQGSYASNVSTLGSTSEVYTVDIVLAVQGINHGDSADHSITMTDCECTLEIKEGEPNTLVINFEILGEVTFT